MTSGRRGTFIVLLVALAALFVWAARVDVPRLTGPIKGDEANFIAMAFSLVEDGDLEYRAEDYRRFHRLYGHGPDGVFLKSAYRVSLRPQFSWPPIQVVKTRVPWTEGLEYGKPFAYAVFAAPFAGLLGLGGLVALNVLLLALCAACAVTFARARLGTLAGTITGLGFVGASIVPVYGAWLTPEVFNLSLVFVAYFLWLYKEVAPPGASRAWKDPRLDWIAALLLGIAAFSKLSNLLLIGPLLVHALLKRQWRHFVAAGFCFALGSAGLFHLNFWMTGESNFQGGVDRKHILSRPLAARATPAADGFPFDGTTTFESTGNVMATNEANDKNILAPDYLIPMLRHNVWYFLVGRDAGFIPYYFPGFVILAWWLFRWRTWTTWQVTTSMAVVGSALGLLVYAPESWNGGGGPVGNRYFLSIYPAILFLVPSGFHLLGAIGAAAVGLTFVGPILLHPFENSMAQLSAPRSVWLNPERWPLRLLPVELTLVADSLPQRLNPLRWRVVVVKEPTVILYYMDSRTYFQEAEGFWVAPGTTDIVVRTEQPLSSITMRMSSDIANEADVSIGGRSQHVTLEPGEIETVSLHPEPGVFAFNSYQTVLTITTARGFYPRDFNPKAEDTRHLGVFIRPQYKVETAAPR